MSEVTGPSSEPKQPLMTAGTVTVPVVRTAGQGGVAWAIMEFVEAFNIYEFDERQWAIVLIIGTTIVSWIQNFLEERAGRRLLGTPE